SRMRDSGRDHHPAGCEVSRETLQQKSSPRIVVGRKALTEESSSCGTHGCSDHCCKVKILLANLEPSTHGPKRGWEMSAFPLLSGDEQTSDERAKNDAHDPKRSSQGAVTSHSMRLAEFA